MMSNKEGLGLARAGLRKAQDDKRDAEHRISIFQREIDDRTMQIRVDPGRDGRPSYLRDMPGSRTDKASLARNEKSRARTERQKQDARDDRMIAAIVDELSRQCSSKTAATDRLALASKAGLWNSKGPSS